MSPNPPRPTGAPSFQDFRPVSVSTSPAGNSSASFLLVGARPPPPAALLCLGIWRSGSSNAHTSHTQVCQKSHFYGPDLQSFITNRIKNKISHGSRAVISVMVLMVLMIVNAYFWKSLIPRHVFGLISNVPSCNFLFHCCGDFDWPGFLQ